MNGSGQPNGASIPTASAESASAAIASSSAPTPSCLMDARPFAQSITHVAVCSAAEARSTPSVFTPRSSTRGDHTTRKPKEPGNGDLS